MTLRKIVPPEFDLRRRIQAVIVEDARTGMGPEETADAILAIIDQARRKMCNDSDCVRRRPHSLIDSHLWKHVAQPPFTIRLPFSPIWHCFSCGRRLAHRIHEAREEVHA
jgi:hypothetical protein